MIRPFLGLSFFVLLFASACGGGGVLSQHQTEGDLCADTAGAYACNLNGDTILVCDDSTLWRRQDACDQGSTCGVSGEEGAEQLCCTVDGAQTCYPEPFALLPEAEPAPEPEPTVG